MYYEGHAAIEQYEELRCSLNTQNVQAAMPSAVIN